MAFHGAVKGAFRCALRTPVLRGVPTTRLPSVGARHLSITYSGGQASEGQGGFYGSGGSRKNTAEILHHPEAVGDMEDIQTPMNIMETVEKLEEQLAESMASHGSSVNEESIELKGAIKRKMSSAKMALLLDRLEINGQPRWGLSTTERAMVTMAREKYTLS